MKKYDVSFILRVRMSTSVEANSMEEAENKLYGRDVLDIVKSDIIEESDIDIISMKKRS